MSQGSNSGASDESLGERSVATSVIRDTGTKVSHSTRCIAHLALLAFLHFAFQVQLMFKAHGLKKRKSLLNSIVTVFKKVGGAIVTAVQHSLRLRFLR